MSSKKSIHMFVYHIFIFWPSISPLSSKPPIKTIQQLIKTPSCFKRSHSSGQSLKGGIKLNTTSGSNWGLFGLERYDFTSKLYQNLDKPQSEEGLWQVQFSAEASVDFIAGCSSHKTPFDQCTLCRGRGRLSGAIPSRHIRAGDSRCLRRRLSMLGQ